MKTPKSSIIRDAPFDSPLKKRDCRGHFVQQAKESVFIISPYLSSWAIALDNLLTYFKEALSKGVKVEIIFDEELNKEEKDGKKAYKPNALQAIKNLSEIGCHVHSQDKIHAKVLASDDAFLVEGSFNWLSAERNAQGLFARYESSIQVVGDEAREPILFIKEKIAKERKKNEPYASSPSTERKKFVEVKETRMEEVKETRMEEVKEAKIEEVKETRIEGLPRNKPQGGAVFM
jgi:hypothetical protein